MKRLLIVLFLFPAALFAIDGKYTQMAQLAEKLYMDGDYQSATQYYQEMVAEGVSSADLYYNLGNALYKSNKLGESILYYEKALRLKPNHKLAAENLNFANKELIDEIDNTSSSYFKTSLKKLFLKLKLNAWALLLLLSLWFFAGCIYAFWKSNNPWIKRIGFLSIGVSFLLCLFFAVVGFSRYSFEVKGGEGIVLNEKSGIYIDPDETTKVKFELNEGSKVEILSIDSNWAKILLVDGREGYIQKLNIGQI